MRKPVIQIAVLALILLAVCAASRLATRNAYTVYIPVPPEARETRTEALRLVAGTPNVVVPGQFERVGDFLRVPVRPGAPGRTAVEIDFVGDDDYAAEFRVDRFGTVYDAATGGFTGDKVVLTAFTVFCLAVAIVMLRAFNDARGPRFYAYSTIHAAGLSLFALLTGLLMLWISVRRALHPREFTMLSAYREITSASFTFMMATAPLMLTFTAAMVVSNVALLRHEGFSPKNLLGIGVSLALVAGEGLAYVFYRDLAPGPAWAPRLPETLQNVYATVFAYFECMLVGAIICGMKAARHVPDARADYVLILGCRTRGDGTLTPLLRGRVDRAVAFWRTCGARAVLLPTGGQGADEPMPEAEAMRRYLLAQGVAGDRILTETESRNTYQNMAFSKALIDRASPGARVVYATSNYHVFRSGVWANRAGLPAEGVGSRTVWWYWPNAAMRECAGLFLNRLPQELFYLLILLSFFGALSLALM